MLVEERCPPKVDSNSPLKHKASRFLNAGLSGALRRVGLQAWKVSTTQRYGAMSQSNHPCDPLAHCQITNGLHQTRSRPDDGRRLRPCLPRHDSPVEGIGSSTPTAGSSNLKAASIRTAVRIDAALRGSPRRTASPNHTGPTSSSSSCVLGRRAGARIPFRPTLSHRGVN